MKKSDHRGKSNKPLALKLIQLIYNTFGRAFPNYFGNRAYNLWFTPARLKTPLYERQALKSATRESIQVNNLSIAVYTWQSETTKPKATLLFVHGWSGRGSQVANYLDHLISLNYRIISFDGAAHGKSEGKQTSFLEMTDIIFALNKHYGPFDCAITHSFGGIALTYAMSLGLAFKRVALVCPPTNYETLINQFRYVLALPDCIINVITRKSYATYGQKTRDAINMTNIVKGLPSCKALLIHDEYDEEVLFHNSEIVANAWQGSQLIKTSGLGHRRIIRDEQVIKHIIQFLGQEKTG